MVGNIATVIGGQYGSEGKGVVVNHLANQYDVHVRVGGPNAGHSFCHNHRVYKMQCIPCGWTNPRAKLVIGAGAYISLERLHTEICTISMVDPTIKNRLFMDENTVFISDTHKQYEAGLKGSIGSTGEGVGAARIHRVMRDPRNLVFAKSMVNTLKELGVRVIDTVEMMWKNRKSGYDILVEGTQGAGLSLIHGPWPYTTSTDVSAAQLLADSGLPIRGTKTIMVIRTFPIRVAGNSGPLKDELTWDELSRELGTPVLEKTTVTGNIRRVGRFDKHLVWDSVMRNEPDEFAVTFMDYIEPCDRGAEKWGDLSGPSKNFIIGIEQEYNIPVTMIGTGWRDGYGWQIIKR